MFRIERAPAPLWLRGLKARADCPPTVMFAGQGDERVAVRAMKLGANDYLPKELVTRQSLEQLVKQAIGANGARVDITLKLEPLAPRGAGAAPGAMPRIEGFRLLREVGCGAVSRVYLMAPEAGGPPVIAKVLFENLVNDSDFLQRFLRDRAA